MYFLQNAPRRDGRIAMLSQKRNSLYVPIQAYMQAFCYEFGKWQPQPKNVGLHGEKNLLKRKGLNSPWGSTKHTRSCKADSLSAGKRRVIQSNSLVSQRRQYRLWRAHGQDKQRCADCTSAHRLILLWEKGASETLSYFPLQEALGDDGNVQIAHSFPESELSPGCTAAPGVKKSAGRRSL